MTPGLIHDMRSSVYHADPCPTPSLSSGVARTLIGQSPAHAYLEHVRLGGHKIEPTAEMILGGYVHALLSGKEDEREEFAIGTFDNYTTKGAKDWRESVQESGRTPILEKTADRARQIEKAIREKSFGGLSRNPLETGKAEVTAVWQEDDCWLRARFDCLDVDETGFADIWDWKTTSDVSPDAITRKIIDQGYHIQAAFYLRGLEKLLPGHRGRITFGFSFVETEAPFAVRRVCLSEGFLSIGRSIIERAVTQWKWCMQANTWPEGRGDTSIVEPPAWYINRITEAA